MATRARHARPEPQPTVDTEHQQALETAQLEQKLLACRQRVESVTQDEAARKLRVHVLMLEDENEDLHVQLGDEENRGDMFEQAVDDALGELETSENQVQRLTNDLKIKTRELENARAELAAMESVTSDSAAHLTSKLALSREIAVLKPEIEHLRAQVASHSNLLADKLSLERQLSTVQVELENEKRTAQRALAKDSSRQELDAEYRSQLDDVRKDLMREQRERSKLERQLERSQEEAAAAERRANAVSRKGTAVESETANEVTELEAELDDLRKELKQEKRDREKAERALEKSEKQLETAKKAKDKKGAKAVDAEQMKELQEQLEQEQQLREKLERQLEKRKQALQDAREELAKLQSEQADSKASASSSKEIESLRAQLASDKAERTKSEKAAKKSEEDWAAEKEVLDDKLNQFRTKLRSTKEKLKETEADLKTVRQEAEKAKAAAAEAAGKATKANPRKRGTASMDPDAAIGTPGDVPAKRRRGASSAPGEKSTFSITPFLNRTTLVAEETPDKAVATNDKEANEEPEQTETPSAVPKRGRKVPTKKAADKPEKVEPLQPSFNKANTKKAPQQRKKSFAPPSLDNVLEEPSQLDENGQTNTTANGNENATSEVPKFFDEPTGNITATAITRLSGPVPKLKPRPQSGGRKSLLNFSSFMTSTDESEPTKIKKKAKKLAGGSSGLGKTLFDDEDEADKLPPKPIPGKGMFAGRMALGKAGAGAAASKAKKGPLMVAEDGFQFSPLKKDRRARKAGDSTIMG